MSKGSKLILPFILAGMFSGGSKGRASIPSYEIEQKKEGNRTHTNEYRSRAGLYEI